MSEVHTRYDEHTGPLPKHSGRDAWTRVQFLSFEAPSDGYGHVSSWHDTSYLGKVPRINNWRAKGEWSNPWWFWMKRYRLKYAKYIQCLPKWPGFDYRWHSNRQSKWLNPLNWWPDKCTPQCVMEKLLLRSYSNNTIRHLSTANNRTIMDCQS